MLLKMTIKSVLNQNGHHTNLNKMAITPKEQWLQIAATPVCEQELLKQF